MERFLAILKDEVQLGALGFMAVVYALRVRWILKFSAPGERTPPRGDHAAAQRYAMFCIVTPRMLSSYREHPIRWVEFVLFHLAVAVAITATFVLPYWPQIVQPRAVAWPALAVVTLGLVAGMSRLARRIVRPEIRIISSPDDFFSLALLDLWLASAFFGILDPEGVIAGLAFFGLTAFFLVYVPFSKISHYLYYPFNKWYVGKHFGHRGVWPRDYQQKQFGVQ